ncbi:Do family serine endopeptidase [Aggregatimonas sangjinii]|uniref:Do family serine endopeptidase n=1 Tax=Aggregatimonas sangjinii TaxID=2583587 RepID=A0A5B7SLM7_9FLAO|nr:Do family serine endopeptidase [Aggregatimonas sangjinii]QCW99494.1 Do family serine endopeptidase [Aggregatimonas sangjinii]
MKNKLTVQKGWKIYLFSALIALVVSFAVLKGNQWSQDKSVTIQQVSGVNGHHVLYTADNDGNIKPLDFTNTSEKVLDAVVHIRSSRTMTNGNVQQFDYRQLPDPFREFFGDRFNDAPQSPDGNLQPQPMYGTGSGVIINKEGYIITNNHVIDDADEVQVTLYNNETYDATVIGTDPTTDLALLQIKADNLKTMAMVNSDDVEVGEWVLAVGNPMGLNSTVTAGIVSAKARNININKEKFAVESFIQTDAAINPGNSGGALVNLEGNLIGINTAIASRTGTYNGYGFAVPSNIVTKVVEDILNYGSVQRGMLGVTIRTMDGTLAQEKNVDFSKGVWVENVGENSAADKAGIEAGDIIIKVNDVLVNTSPRLQEIIASKRPGDKVNVAVKRNGKEKSFDVVLENSKGTTAIMKKEKKEVLNLLGADFETLDADTAKKLNIDGGVKVVRLYPGKIRKETQMREGFIITHIDGKEVKNIEDVAAILEDKDGGVLLEGTYEDKPGSHYYAFGMDS